MTDGELTCAEVVELVTDYLEGALAAEPRARFEAHLADCDDCATYLAQLRATRDALGRLTEDDADPETLDLLRDAFRGWHCGTAG